MATPQNRSNTKAGSGQETSKKNYTAQRYGQNDGELRFGQIDKQGRVTAGVQLNARKEHIPSVWIMMEREKVGLQASLQSIANAVWSRFDQRRRLYGFLRR